MEKMTKLALENGRDYSELKEIKQIQGGSINEAFYVRTQDAEYFMKHHANPPPRFFKNEAVGLRMIKETHTIAVPNYYSYSDSPGEAFLLLEWIEGEENKLTQQKLGENLAKLHLKNGPMHGLATSSHIGILEQPNELEPNWLSYFGKYRMEYHIKKAIDESKLTGTRKASMLKLLDNLDKWIPPFVEPSYLHGDLYDGNWLVGNEGKPYLVDPSFFYGDRQLELAFTEVFGGFDPVFYDAYNEIYPLRADYEEIKPIYQLYYILVHFIMFGEPYGEKIDEILKRYV